MPHATVQVDHEGLEDRLLAVEVQVERAEADAGALGDLHDRCLVIPLLREHLLGGFEQPAPRRLAALRQRSARRGRYEFRLLVEQVTGNAHGPLLPPGGAHVRADATVRASRSWTSAALRRTRRAREP